MEQLLERWSKQSFRGALVGAKGSGKTTLLLELQQRLHDQGFEVHCLQRRPGEAPLPRLTGASPQDVFTLDGAEQLGLRERRLFCRDVRKAGGVIATSHRPLSWLPTLLHHRVDPELFARWVEDLTHSQGFSCPWSHPRLAGLLEEENGNVRESFRRLFDQAPRMLRPADMANTNQI